MSLKSCTKCGQSKPMADFHLYASGKPKSWCKVCQLAYMRDKRRDIPKVTKAVIKRRERLKEKFGITEQEYDAMLVAQHGVCAICGMPERKIIRGVVPPLAVDHCHTTGNVRGLLCHACNIGLGMFRDNPGLLVKAIEYIHDCSPDPKI